jgi:hypothetical protein
MPALSPPEVRTASFILYFGGVVVIAAHFVLDVADESEKDRVFEDGGASKIEKRECRGQLESPG